MTTGHWVPFARAASANPGRRMRACVDDSTICCVAARILISRRPYIRFTDGTVLPIADAKAHGWLIEQVAS